MTETRQQLETWFQNNRMSLTERFEDCGFVYFDQPGTEDTQSVGSGRVYWNVEADEKNQTQIHLAVQHGEANEETLALVREGVNRYLALKHRKPTADLSSDAAEG